MKYLLIFISIISFPVFAEDYQGDISDTRMFYNIYGETPYISTIGYINNDSEYPLEDISIEVRYFDEKGNIIDSDFENIYSLVVPPKEKVSFKLQATAIAEKDSYSSHEVHIIHAAQNIPCNKKSKSRNNSNTYNTIKKVLIGWFPLLLLIFIWIFFVKKYSGKGSNQHKLVELMERQVEYDRARNKEISSIAKTLRSRHDSGE